MRTFAIGDIHGNLNAFDAVLRVIDPKPEDLLITLGDYIDGGHGGAGAGEQPG